MNRVAPRALAGAAAGFQSAVLVYALVRVIQAFVVAEPNAATVIASAHAGYFWRIWTAVYLGGFVALGITLLGRHTDRIVRASIRALPWTAAIAVAQALLVP